MQLNVSILGKKYGKLPMTIANIYTAFLLRYKV